MRRDRTKPRNAACKTSAGKYGNGIYTDGFWSEYIFTYGYTDGDIHSDSIRGCGNEIGGVRLISWGRVCSVTEVKGNGEHIFHFKDCGNVQGNGYLY